MELSKLPVWLLVLSLLLISVCFIVSLYALDEPRTFAGLEFGPKHPKGEAPQSVSWGVNVKGQELPSNGGNTKSSVCPEKSYMIGVRFQSDKGGPHGIVSNIFPVCRTLNVTAQKQ